MSSIRLQPNETNNFTIYSESDDKSSTRNGNLNPLLIKSKSKFKLTPINFNWINRKNQYQIYLIKQLNMDYILEKKKYPQFIYPYDNEANDKFNTVMHKLNKINLTNITISLTDSYSLFFRLNNIKESNNSFSLDIHIEVFFGEENKESFEAICSLYNGNDKCFSNYGKLNYVLNSILEFCHLYLQIHFNFLLY